MAGRAQMLDHVADRTPVTGTVDVTIPVEVLWNFFARAENWPRWNSCMFWVRNHELVLGEQLIWIFEPLRWWYGYKLPAKATIVELETNRKVTWEVTFIPGFYARHTYTMEELGNERTRFGSWEMATGPTFLLLQAFWLAHFRFVKDRSLAGVRSLEVIYKRTGTLDLQYLPPKDYALSLLPLTAIIFSFAVLIWTLHLRWHRPMGH